LGVLQQIALHLAAKRKTNCCKTQGKLLQNARWNGAKCRWKRYKTQVEMYNFSYCMVG